MNANNCFVSSWSALLVRSTSCNDIRGIASTKHVEGVIRCSVSSCRPPWTASGSHSQIAMACAQRRLPILRLRLQDASGGRPGESIDCSPSFLDFFPGWASETLAFPVVGEQCIRLALVSSLQTTRSFPRPSTPLDRCPFPPCTTLTTPLPPPDSGVRHANPGLRGQDRRGGGGAGERSATVRYQRTPATDPSGGMAITHAEG